MSRSVENLVFMCAGIVIGAVSVLLYGKFDHNPERSVSLSASAGNTEAMPVVEDAGDPAVSANVGVADNHSEEGRAVLDEQLENESTIPPISLPEVYEQHINPTEKTVRFSDLHKVFKGEPRDEPWAAAMEAGISHSIANSSSSEFIVVEYLECRSRMCELAGYRRSEDVHPTEILTDFARSGAWPGRFSTHTTSFGDDIGKRFITILNGYRAEEYESVFLAQ